MALVFPAILIGGPPHSGKSTLTYRLRQALLRHGIIHYALRASPDGEGNWYNEAPHSVVAELRARAKDRWSEDLATYLSRDVANRHLPLLVDAGSVPSPETAMIAAQCTHAILLAADPTDLAPWRELVETHGLALLADLDSLLAGPSSICDDGAMLRGVIGGLAPEQSSDGICFDALCRRVAQVFAYDADELYRAHLALTDLDLVLHVERAIYPLPAHAPNGWRPDELPALIDSLPRATPLGIYGIGPVWLYAALAVASHPARCAVFDPRHGWVEPPPLRLAEAPGAERLRWDGVHLHPDHLHIRLSIPRGYLDYRDAPGTPIPPALTDRGVILDGKLPNWLAAAIARAYADTPWVALYYPPINGAVVVRSRDPAVPLGSVRALEAV